MGLHIAAFFLLVFKFSPTCRSFAFVPRCATKEACAISNSVGRLLLHEGDVKLLSVEHVCFMAGGGFGDSSGTPRGLKGSRSSRKKNNQSSKKVRSVSGFAASGTKALRVAANTFDELRKKYGVECCNDVYVRSPSNDDQTCWFVGKIARRLDNTIGGSIPSEMEAVLSQKRLILEYARQLRPQNLGGPNGNILELWISPGDSEMDAVQNKVSFVQVQGSTADISDTFNVANVGFNPEIYVGEEIKTGGLRVLRDSSGKPVKPVFEINQ